MNGAGEAIEGEFAAGLIEQDVGARQGHVVARYLDDRMVVDLHLIKQMDTLNPRLEVEIETIADWQFDPQYVVLEPATKDSSEDGQARKHMLPVPET